jgi:fucose permease
MSRRKVALITFTCYAAFLILGIAGSLFGPAIQSLTQRFNMRLADGAIFVSLQWVGATIAMFTAGRLMDRINIRYVLSGGTLMLGIGLILVSIAPSLPMGLVGALLVGIGTGTLGISPNLIILSLNPDNAAAALNFLNGIWGAGAIIGPQIVNFALSRQQVALAFGGTAIISLLLIIPFSMASMRLNSGDDSKRVPIRWMSLLPFAALLGVYVGTEVGFGSWIFTQLTKAAQSTEAIGTIATSLFWAGLTAGRLVATPVLRRLTDEQLLIVSIIFVGVGAGLFLIAPGSETIGLISAFIVGMGCGPIFPTALAIVNNSYPEQRGTATGALMALGAGSAAILPWLQGQIGAGRNGGMIVPFVASIYLLGVAFIIQRRLKTHASLAREVISKP